MKSSSACKLTIVERRKPLLSQDDQTQAPTSKPLPSSIPKLGLGVPLAKG
eukprot:CAMPEP_0169073236 /NCGR_PEP_ID=MMETSP1015-20121227/6632_1 /TAXON_ID=342587 /ORGANISM="Karlodinium micrum, Strain CCMP2283" /LENGTH=49 /DNA_ID= /DNA_START= /DNA_END= /DNA_ORIENTATION=